MQKNIEKNILKAIIETEERERNRFARDLHDGLSGLLSAIKIHLGILQKGLYSPGEDDKILTKAMELISEASKSTREIANNLKPGQLSRLGLVPAIRGFCEKIQDSVNICIHFEDNLKSNIEDNIEAMLYRVVFELVHNTVKHAGAKNIYMKIYDEDEKLFFFYEDDGIGFDPSEMDEFNGMGLKNIKARVNSVNGFCNFNSELGKGMKAIIEIDLSN